MKTDKKIWKIAAIFIMIFLIMASAVQAVVNTNTRKDSSEDEDPYVALMGDNYVWEDDFNNGQGIDIDYSENYIVEDGKVKMIDTYTQWTDPNFERMKIITLSSIVSGEVAIKLEVDYDTDMKNNYGDIKFKFQGDDAWLDYWIEEKNPVPSDPYAIFWVKVEDLPTGNSEMHMFYKNPNSYDESDYWAVFDEDSWTSKYNIDERATNHYYKEGAWDPDVCFGEHDNEDVFLVTWEEGTAYWPAQGTVFQQQIRGRYYDLDGNPVSDRFDIVDEPQNPPAYGYRYENPSGKFGKNDKFFVAYNVYSDWTWIPPQFTNMDIEGAIVDNPVDGASTRFTICDASGIQADPCVAWDDENDQFLVVWEDGRQGTNNYDIYGRLYNYNGNSVGSAFAICNQPNIQCEPWVTFDNVNEHYLVVWEESADNPETGPFEIWGQLLTSTGSPIGGRFQISEDGTTSTDYNFPCVAFCELTERFLVTWQEDDISDGDWTGSIWGQILDQNGDVYVDTFEVANGEFCRTDVVPYLTTSFFVSYDNWGGSSGDIWGKMVNDTGSVNSYTLQLSDINNEPCDWTNIGSNGDKIFVAWEDARVTYQNPFDDMSDVYFNVWSLNIPSSSQVTYSFGDEISMVLDAHIVSKKINPTNWEQWVLFDATKTGDVDFDLLDGETLQILIPDISPGANIESINTDNIRLKARFHRDDPSTTPNLDYWKVEYIGTDTEPPLTQVQDRDGIKGKNDIWISDGVIIWLMAQDFPVDTGSGVDATYYTLNSGPTETYSEDSGMQLTVNSGTNWMGEWDIYFWSVDKSGNVETPPKYEYVKIDAERPYCEITYPEDEAQVEVPFWIKASATDNDEIDYVEFNIEPFEERVPVPDFDYPYEWWCDVEEITDVVRERLENNPSDPQQSGVNVMIRAQAFDKSGQTWIWEHWVFVKNWDQIQNVNRNFINNRPLLELLKLGFALGKTLDVEIPTPDNADTVIFEATKIFIRKQTTIIDYDLSDGCSASFDISTGFYKITTYTYKEDEQIANEMISRVFYINT